MQEDNLKSSSIGKRFVKEYLHDGLELLEAYMSKRQSNNKYTKLMKLMDKDFMVFITIREALAAITNPTPVSAVSISIASILEDDLRFRFFQQTHPDLYAGIIRGLKDKNSTDYRYFHRAMINAMKKQELIWNKWTHTEVIGLGGTLLGVILPALDFLYVDTAYEKNLSWRVLKPTDDIKTWVQKSENFLATLYPKTSPTLYKPFDWTTPYDGGFIEPELNLRVPLVKRSDANAQRMDVLSAVDMPKVYSAVNTLQATAWTINPQVFAVVKEVLDRNLQICMPSMTPIEIPPYPDGAEDHEIKAWKIIARDLYAKDKKRIADVLEVTHSIKAAHILEDVQAFYFTWQMDWRGRLYPVTSSISPQGGDLSRSLLTFAEGKPLGEYGLTWLKIHGANCYGHNKSSYEERVKFINDNHKFILETAEDPIGNREFWRYCDKPWQFLAFIFEYANCVKDPTYCSKLSIGVDGSCNGIQHYSAMLCDAVGARSTNLVDNPQPSDIYNDVGSVAFSRLATDALDNPLAALWYSYLKDTGIPRALVKKPVMTLPYGSTLGSATNHVYLYIREHDIQVFAGVSAMKAAAYLAKLIWNSIGSVVVKAREAMAYLKKCTTLVNTDNRALVYTTPDGFVMYQYYEGYDAKMIRGAYYSIELRDKNGELNKRHQLQGTAPNFVHSLDATHLRATVNSAALNGVTSFHMVHDDYGTHACDVAMLQRCLRRTFTDIHKHNQLLEFKKQVEANTGITLPAVPDSGTYVLDTVLTSKYFFS